MTLIEGFDLKMKDIKEMNAVFHKRQINKKIEVMDETSPYQIRVRVSLTPEQRRRKEFNRSEELGVSLGWYRRIYLGCK